MSLTVFDFLTTSHKCLLRWKVYWAADISTTDHLHHLTVIVILSIKAETLRLSANQSLLFFSVRPIRKPQAFLIDHPVGRTSEFPAWPENIEIKIIDHNTEITMTDQRWKHKNYNARSGLKRRSLTSFSGGHWTRYILQGKWSYWTKGNGWGQACIAMHWRNCEYYVASLWVSLICVFKFECQSVNVNISSVNQNCMS